MNWTKNEGQWAYSGLRDLKKKYRYMLFPSMRAKNMEKLQVSPQVSFRTLFPGLARGSSRKATS